MTEPEPLQQISRTWVRFRNRKLCYFSGCDYFRLASHPKVLAAVQSGLRNYGLNVAASRLTTGNHVLYEALEERLANFFEAENALLVSTGSLTNLIVAQALAGNFSHALIDSKSHPSLSDAARVFDCPVLEFAHRDAGDLSQAIGRCGPESKLILLTDGMFSHDGSVAPLADYLKVLPADAFLLVDDAHGAGALGKTGKGSIEHAGARRRRIIQTITLSKAFGTYGGAILGTASLRDRILRRSKLFVGSTPPPLPLASAGLQAVQLLKTDKSLRQRLASNTTFVKTALREASHLAIPATKDRHDFGNSLLSPGPIISLGPRHQSDILKLRRALLAANIYPPFIQYPGGRPGGYFRFAISSEHTRGQLDALLGVLGPRLR